jgi:hypothetical protein
VRLFELLEGKLRMPIEILFSGEVDAFTSAAEIKEALVGAKWTADQPLSLRAIASLDPRLPASIAAGGAAPGVTLAARGLEAGDGRGFFAQGSAAEALQSALVGAVGGVFGLVSTDTRYPSDKLRIAVTAGLRG